MKTVCGLHEGHTITRSYSTFIPKQALHALLIAPQNCNPPKGHVRVFNQPPPQVWWSYCRALFVEHRQTQLAEIAFPWVRRSQAKRHGEKLKWEIEITQGRTMTCMHLSNAGGKLNLSNYIPTWNLRPLESYALRVFECFGMFVFVSPVEWR